MNYALLTPMLLLLPLLSFAILGIWGRRHLHKIAGIFGTLMLAIITVLSVAMAVHYFLQAEPLNGAYQSIIAFQFDWLSFGSNNLSIDVGALLDPISIMMLVVVTVVSLMVHIFSLGYMKGEERYATYYAFLSLFTFSMLGLVLASNLFQLYLFWELVGVSSYLLIGFYYTKPSAVAAAKKAFIVTRFADFAFLIGILILGIEGGSFDFLTMIERLTNPASTGSIALASASFIGASALTWALALIFIGGAGKSALFPLHIWLPDAMEGPTPVSALIHAATMVVAGVFLVARLFPIFHFNQSVLELVVWVGAASALFAAVIACTQTDIKRVLAYSTMSQIGYMIFALGVSDYEGANGLGYTASMYHLFTHAFFKALLFLTAGAVIHKVHSNEIKDMFGLRKAMPVTHICFLMAAISIAGLPPFAGFFSKEAILLAAYENHPIIYGIGLLTAGITAFYMTRLYFGIFGKPAGELQTNHHHGEGTLSLKIPMLFLAVLSIAAGWIPFSQYITADQKPFDSSLHLAFSIAPVAIVLAGIAAASYLYHFNKGKSQQLKMMFGGFYKAAYQKFYIDEVYLFITRKLVYKIIGQGAAQFDRKVVDGSVTGIGSSTSLMAEKIKGLQNGKVQTYLLVFFGGILFLTLVFAWWYKQ